MNLDPSPSWTDYLMRELARQSEYRGLFNSVPQIKQQEIADSYKNVVAHYMSEVRAGVKSYNDVAAFFTNQAELWWDWFRGNKVETRNYFEEDRPSGWTVEQCRAADSLDYLFRCHASVKLKNYFSGLAGNPTSNHPLHPDELPSLLPESIHSKIYSPPLDYADKWQIIEDLPPPLDREISTGWRKALAKGEIGFDWQASEFFIESFNNFLASVYPKKFLQDINSLRIRPLLDYLFGELQFKLEPLKNTIDKKKRIAIRSPQLDWLARQMNSENHYKVTQSEEEAYASLSALQEIVEDEMLRRRINPRIYDDVNILIKKYSTQTNMHVTNSQARVLISKCAFWAENLDKYSSSPKVVQDKVQKWMNGHERVWLSDEESAHLAEVNDNSPKQSPSTSGLEISLTQAQIARRAANVSKFHYSLYKDFLNSYALGILSEASEDESSEEVQQYSFLTDKEDWGYYLFFLRKFDGEGSYKAKCEILEQELSLRMSDPPKATTLDRLRKQLNKKAASNDWDEKDRTVLRRVRSQIEKDGLLTQSIDDELVKALNPS